MNPWINRAAALVCLLMVYAMAYDHGYSQAQYEQYELQATASAN